MKIRDLCLGLLLGGSLGTTTAWTVSSGSTPEIPREGSIFDGLEVGQRVRYQNSMNGWGVLRPYEKGDRIVSISDDFIALQDEDGIFRISRHAVDEVRWPASDDRR